MLIENNFVLFNDSINLHTSVSSKYGQCFNLHRMNPLKYGSLTHFQALYIGLVVLLLPVNIIILLAMAVILITFTQVILVFL